MKKYSRVILFLLILLFTIVLLTGCTKEKKDNNKFEITTSFYPINIMVLNITDGAKNVEVKNMTSKNVGCIHEYTLTTNDLINLETTDVFIENGLGIENFLTRIKNTYKDLNIIDSSENIVNLLKDEDETNAHTWTSVANNIVQVRTITEKLCELNPENSEIYKKNSEEYIAKLQKVMEKENEIKAQISNLNAISFNESIEYFLKEMNVNVKTLHTDHEEITFSAEKLNTTILEAKNESIKIVFIDKNEQNKNAELVARETGANIYELKSAISGEYSKDSYIEDIQYNLNTLQQIINEGKE